MEVSSEPGFWEFQPNCVTGKLCAPCRNVGGLVAGQSRAWERQRLQDQKGGDERLRSPTCL